MAEDKIDRGSIVRACDAHGGVAETVKAMPKCLRRGGQRSCTLEPEVIMSCRRTCKAIMYVKLCWCEYQ